MLQLVHMIVLGIDPGYDRVGWGVINVAQNQKITVLSYGCIQTSKTAPLIGRYLQITEQLKNVLETYKTDAAAIEQIFFSRNQTTAIRVSESRGVILATLLPYAIPISEYTPNQVKLAVTGYGNADKQAVEKMIRLQLKLSQEKVIDDTIDALAIAFTHTILRHPQL